MSLMPPKREGTTLLNKAVQINLPRVFGATPSAGFCLGTLIFIGATQLIGSESDHCSFGAAFLPRVSPLKASTLIPQQTKLVGTILPTPGHHNARIRT
jgi:hypothetical protein